MAKTTTADAATTPSVLCGTQVTYTDTKGHSKTALVTGTPETVVEGTSLPTLAEGELHLYVVSPSGQTYGRRNVPFGAPKEVEASATVVPEVPESKIATWTQRAADKYGYEEGSEDFNSYLAHKSEKYIAAHTYTPGAPAPVGFWTV